MKVLVATTNIAAHAAGPLPLVAELVRRGHDVRWYAGSAYADAIESVGAVRIPVRESVDFSGEPLLDAFPVLRGMEGPAMIREAFARIFIGLAPGQVRDLQAALQAEPADVMLADTLFFAAGLVHELGGPPYASINDSMLAVPSRDTAPFGPGIAPMKGRVGRLRNRVLTIVAQRVLFRQLDDVYTRVRAEVGLGPVADHVMSVTGSPDLLLHPGVPSFEYPRSDLPDRVCFVGPMLPALDPGWMAPRWWADLEGRPVVHVTQGTVNNDPMDLILPTLLALADEDVLVVATTGGPSAADLELLLGRSLPANARVVPYLPYREVLSRAAVCVTNGGYSGVTMALAHGVPLVQAGVTEEKREVGARIAYTGVGVALKTSRPGEAQLRRAVRQVLSDPRHRVAAQRVRDDMARHDGPVEAADLLEQLAAGRRTGVGVEADSTS